MDSPKAYLSRHVLQTVLIVLILIGIGVGVFRYHQMSAELDAIKKDPTKVQQVSKAEIKQLVVAVGKLMELPDKVADPTVATVQDVEKLRAQPFFASAKNGDKVLIFSDMKKAVLYRPETNRIIDISPLTTVATPTSGATQTTASTGTPPAATAPTFILLNGSKTAGLTKKYEDTLKKKVPTAVISQRGNTEGDYATSLLIDPNNKHKTEAAEMAKNLSLTLATLPKNEATAPADIDYIVILGADIK